jgi:uncharacterized caspase-like protein
MKQILTFFVVVLLVGGCQSSLRQPNPPMPVDDGSTLRTTSHSGRQGVSEKIKQFGDIDSSKKALVIGNANYDYSPLQNPVNDAKAMTDSLVNLGFHVTRATNLDHETMQGTVEAFKSRLSNEEVALFYFSGHGAQVGGQNFLLPVNNGIIRGEKELKKNALSAQKILVTMKEANNGVNLLVLDACRDNPYSGSGKNMNRGLAQMKSPRGALIAFAAAPGQAALDGEGYNGLYTSYLLDALENAEHKRIEDVFMGIQGPVVDESGGKQEPWYQASFRKPFCFGGCSSP